MNPVEREAEEIYQRLCRKKSVLGVMVFSENASIGGETITLSSFLIPCQSKVSQKLAEFCHPGVRSSMDGISTTDVSTSVFPLVDTARRTVEDLDPTDELLFIRIRTRRGETIVGTEGGNVYVVLQDGRFIRTPQMPK